jgi:hypothetical protein
MWREREREGITLGERASAKKKEIKWEKKQKDDR